MMVIVLTVIKTSIVLGAAMLAVRLGRRTRATVRHVVLAAAFLALLVLPVAMAVLPEVPIAFRRRERPLTRRPLLPNHPYRSRLRRRRAVLTCAGRCR